MPHARRHDRGEILHRSGQRNVNAAPLERARERRSSVRRRSRAVRAVNRGDEVSSEVRSGGAARLFSADGTHRRVPRFSRLLPPAVGDSRSGPRTLAHRLPPLEPQASKRHDVPDLRRRATREQRGRPEHPRVEPPGASFARHLTHVHARVRSKRGGCICRFSMTAYTYGSRFFRRKPREKAGFFDGAVPRRSRDSFSPEPLFAIPPFASAGQVPQARPRRGRRRVGVRKPPQKNERRVGARAARAGDQRGALGGKMNPTGARPSYCAMRLRAYRGTTDAVSAKRVASGIARRVARRRRDERSGLPEDETAGSARRFSNT